MAIVATDLLSPKGRLEPSFFPDDDPAALETRLTGYLADATPRIPEESTEAEADVSKEAWAYHRAYDAMATRQANAAASVTLNDQGSRAYQSYQLKALREQSDYWLQRFLSSIVVEDIEPEGQLLPGTQGVPTDLGRW